MRKLNKQLNYKYLAFAKGHADKGVRHAIVSIFKFSFVQKQKKKKKKKKKGKQLTFFNIFAQDIDCGYTLKPPRPIRTGTLDYEVVVWKVSKNTCRCYIHVHNIIYT